MTPGTFILIGLVSIVAALGIKHDIAVVLFYGGLAAVLGGCVGMAA